MNLADMPGPVGVERSLCRRHLKHFIEAAWHVVEPKRPYQHNWHIDAICEHLEAINAGQIRNLVINMPPRHSKSTLISVMWFCWTWTHSPERRWIFSSYSQRLAIRDSVKCRRIIDSPWYRGLFGDVFQITQDQNEKTKFENDKTGVRMITSVGGGATGEGAEILVCDDPHKASEIYSDTKRERALMWWDEEMSTRENDPAKTAKVIVMQRLHEKDLAGHLVAEKGYEHLRLPAEFDGKKVRTSIGWEDPRKAAGELLWPERFDLEFHKRKRIELGARAYAGQFGQEPAPADGTTFRREWWKFWTKLPERFDRVITSWDLSFDVGNSAAYNVGQAWGVHQGKRYLIAQIRERLGFTGQVEAIKKLAATREDFTEHLIEKKANGAAAIDVLKAKFPNLIAIEPRGDKLVRAEAVSPQVEAGSVYLPDPALNPWVEDFIERCTKFPNVEFKDEIDAMSQALTRLDKKSSGIVHLSPEDLGVVGHSTWGGW